MIRLALNLRKPYNYAFFDPKSRIHLTVSSPVGFANEVTPAILRGLRSQVLIDVDGVVDAKTGMITEKKDDGKSKPAKKDTPILQKEPEVEAPKEEEITEPAPVEESKEAEPVVEDNSEAEPVPEETDAKDEAQGEEEAKPKKKSNKKK